MNRRTLIFTSLMLGLASVNSQAAPQGGPDKATLGKLAQIFGKIAPPRAAPNHNSFAALQTLAPNTAGVCKDALADVGNGRKLWAIYVIGSDLEEDRSYATTNLKQLVAGWNALANRDDLDVIVAFGGARKDGWKGVKYASLEQVAADLADGALGNSGNYLYSDDKADMGLQATFEAFLSYTNGRFGGNSRKMLSFWNHGSSYSKQPGVGPDMNTRNVLDLTKINQGLAGSQSCYHLIGFDACLMASMESAAALKDFAQYLVASEELEPGHGWNYAHVLTALAYKPSHLEVAKGMVDSFVNSASHAYADNGKTLSVLNLGEVGNVTQALEATSQALAANVAGNDAQAVIRAFYNSQQYAGKLSVDPELIPSQVAIDLKDFLSIVATRTPDDNLKQNVAATTAAIDKMVAYSRHDGSRPGSTGVSIAPLDISTAKLDEQVQVGLINPGWGKLVAAYRAIQQKSVVPALVKMQTGVPGASLSYVSARDATPDSATAAAMAAEQGMTATFSSPYLADVRGTFGQLDSDGGLLLLGETPAYPTADGSYFFEQWNGHGFALATAGETVYVPALLTQVANQGANYNALVMIENSSLSTPQLGLMSIEPDNSGNISYAIALIQEYGDNWLLTRKNVTIQANDTVSFFTIKLKADGGSDVALLARQTFSDTPLIRQQPYTKGNYGYTLAAYSVGDMTGIAPIQPVSPADRVFNWGAAQNPAFQLESNSRLMNGYYARCNSGKTVCAGAMNNALWFYDGSMVANLGSLNGWLSQAVKAGY